MIGALLDLPVEERLHGSVAAALVAVERGARIVRVHDVAATVQALAVWNAVSEVTAAEETT
jgi:dihydropteroate synthase